MSLLKTFDLLRSLGAHLGTDEIIDERKSWQNCPLGEVYSILAPGSVAVQSQKPCSIASPLLTKTGCRLTDENGVMQSWKKNVFHRSLSLYCCSSKHK
jgi:hypothetical protein